MCYKDREKQSALRVADVVRLPLRQPVTGFRNGGAVLTAENVILTLKVAVVAVTLLLLGSLAALLVGRYRLHGRLNLAVFILTIAALLGLEGIARLLAPDLFRDYFDKTDAWTALYVHLSFSMPAAAVLCVMLYTGLRHRRALHVPLGFCFLALWAGTLITGLFFLPHGGVP
jgi:hypothetical protein